MDTSSTPPGEVVDVRTDARPEGHKQSYNGLELHRRPNTVLNKVHYYPPRPSSSPSPESFPDGTARIKKKGRSNDSSANTSPTLATTPFLTRIVPGNYIDAGESAGLPGTKDLRKFSASKARNVVKMHLRISNRSHSSTKLGSPGDSRLRSRRKAKHNHLAYISSTGMEKDLEQDGGPPSPQGGGGILSSLLNLYHLPDIPTSASSSRRSSTDREYTPQSSPERSPKRWNHTPYQEKHHTKRRGFRFRKHSYIPSLGQFSGPIPRRPGFRYGLEDSPSLEHLHPAAALKRNQSAFSDLQRYSSSDHSGATTPPTPSSPKDPFYQQDFNNKLSGLLGGYSHLTSSGHRSETDSPGSCTDYVDGKRSSFLTKDITVGRRSKKKSEVYITRHVAHIIRRQEFLMKLTRAMMMFGGPSHRLQAQMQSAARVLDIELSFLYLPDVALLSFDDSSTGTSHIKLIRQTSSLDLGKLDDAFALYWKVIHDDLSVSDASVELDALMCKASFYSWWQLIFIGGMCSAAICSVSFAGSFIDSLVSFPLGALLVGIQLLSARNILYSYVFEVTISTLFSFISAALAQSHRFCYSAIASSSVVLILPGLLVLIGALELMSRNIISGSVRLCFAVAYSLFLGFGFIIGAEMFELMTSRKVFGPEDYPCSLSHDPYGPWYQRTPSEAWAFLTVPMYSLFLSMRIQAPWNRKEIVLIVAISCLGWITNYLTGVKFGGQSDLTAAVGAFAVGLVANLHARVFGGNAFVVMITGILFQLPSGLGSGGLLTYALQETSGSADSYIVGFRIALKLISVAIGLTIGLGLSLVLMHPIQSRKREAGIFSL